jgi:hypothetical protein
VSAKRDAALVHERWRMALVSDYTALNSKKMALNNMVFTLFPLGMYLEKSYQCSATSSVHHADRIAEDRLGLQRH